MSVPHTPAADEDALGPFAAKAAWYLGQGYTVVPLAPQGATPLHNPTRSHNVAALYAADHPQANLGLVLPPNAVAITIEKGEGGGPAGLVAHMQAVGGAMPPTKCIKTAHGGLQAIFTHPPYTKAPPAYTHIHGLTITVAPAHIVAPPSVHPNGTTLTWVQHKAPLAPLPAWLAAYLATPAPEAGAGGGGDALSHAGALQNLMAAFPGATVIDG